MDTKYRETLPNLIRDLPSGTFSDDECASMITAISKKARKSKKTKVGKNGLHAGEEVDITRWWIGRDMSFATSDSPGAREDAVKTALLEQRARETQLQIILVLETLALEASATEPAADPTSLKDLKKRDEDSQRKPKKPRKLQDLDTLLDLLADRLCIWQDMSIDQAKSSSADKRPSSEHGAKVPIEAARNDCLRQFCVDVVLPL